MKKRVIVVLLFLLFLAMFSFHNFTKTYTNKVSNLDFNASNTTPVKINYRAGSGTGSNYSVNVTPQTKNYADNVAVLIKNKGVTDYTHADVTKTINSTNYTYHMILTGWKLVSVVQNGTTITTFEEPDKYNYADRTNAKKDIGTIYSEEGYYYIPDGVTEATFEAVYGWAIYIKDPYTTMKFDTNYWFNTDASIATGRTGSADSNFGTNDSTDVVASFKRAYELIQLAGEGTSSYTMYDHVIVMMGNVTDVRPSQGSQPSTCHTDTVNNTTTVSNCLPNNSNWGYTTADVPVTITSNPNGTTRYTIYTKAQTWGYQMYGDVRFDFVNWTYSPTVSGGVSKASPIMYQNKGTTFNKLEFTERHTSGYRVYITTSAVVQSLKINGGSYYVRYTDHPFTGTPNYENLKYVIVGGNASSFMYSNTATSELSANKGTVINPPTLNILGGNIETIYLAGASSPSTLGFTRADNTVYMFATGGRFNNQIFASGISKLDGNAYIDLDGVTSANNISTGGNNSNSKITGNVTINIKNSSVKDVYGGPLYGDILGTSNVNIYNTTVNGTVYGGGYGATSTTSSRETGYSDVNFATVVERMNSVSTCSADGMTCYNSANEEIPNVKKINNQVRYYLNSPSYVTRLLNNDTKTLLGFTDSTHNIVRTKYQINMGTSLVTVYSDSYQLLSSLSAATVQDVNIDIDKSNITGNVFAGGNRGSVNGNTTVTIKDSTIGGTVYGGGYTVSSNTVPIYYKQYSFYNLPYGYVSGSNVAYVGENNNFYNGSSIVSNARHENFTWRNYDYLLTNSSSWIVNDLANYESYWGSGSGSNANVINGIDYVNKVVYSNVADKMGTVYGNSSVTLNNTKVTGNVYGGGYAGISEGNVDINITNGSTISGHVYAGAYSSSVSGKSTITLANGSTINGNLYGGGEGQTSTLTDSELNVSGRVKGSIYGGSYAGKVTGTSIVNLKTGGVVDNDLYGGGYGSSSISNDVAINVTGTVTKSLYGGSYAGSVTGATAIGINAGGIVTNSVFGGGYGDTSTLSSCIMNINGNVNGSLYGGSYAGTVTGTSTINLNSGGTVANNLYGGGYGETSVLGNSIIYISGTASKSVYGGSFAGTVTNSSQVTISGSGQVSNNVFGAGEGATSRIKNTTVTVEGRVNKDVYGGSDLGLVGNGVIDGVNNTASITQLGSATVNVGDGANILGSVYGAGNGAPDGQDSMHIEYGALFGPTNVTVTGGTIAGNLYGGGNRSRVFVSSGNAVVMNITYQNSYININGAVFGGGNSAGDSGVNASVPTVIGNTNVTITDSSFGDYTNILGGVYGGGNLCLVKGTKTVTINNFGSTSEVAIKTLQRSDTVTLNNSNVHIDSARDVVNEFDTDEYSINRVGNLYFRNGSKVTINKMVNYLGNITSDDTGNAVKKNYLYINNGLLTKIEKEDNTYGLVTGKFKLGLINYATGDGGGFLFANTNSTGDFSSVNNNQMIINDTYPNNYKFWYLEGDNYNYTLKVTGYTKAANTYIVELPLVQNYGKAFNLSLQSASYSNTFRTYLQNNPYIDLTVAYKTGSVSALNLTSAQPIYNETSTSTATMPTLLLELNINSRNLENTIEDEVVNLVLSDGTDTYKIALEIDIVDQVIGNSIFTNSGKWYNGVSLSDDINVSNNSSYTVQFLTTYVPRLYSDIELTLETTRMFYKGTRITLIDTTDENDINYYYYIVGNNTNKIMLDQFRKMGKTNEYFSPHFSNRSINENLNFIIDMSDSNTASGVGTIMLGHYSNNVEILGNTATTNYTVVGNRHPSIVASLNNYGRNYYNFDLNIVGPTNTTADDTEATNQYLLEVKHKDNSAFELGAAIKIGNNTYVPTSTNKSIIIPITVGAHQLQYKTKVGLSGNDLTFRLYYGTDSYKSSVELSKLDYTVPHSNSYTFGINNNMNRIIEKNATAISVPLTYSNFTNPTLKVELQSKTINSNGTYTYTTLKDYLKNDDSSGKVTITPSNNVSINLENNKLESMKTYNLLFTVTDNNGYTFTDSVEIVAK